MLRHRLQTAHSCEQRPASVHARWHWSRSRLRRAMFSTSLSGTSPGISVMAHTERRRGTHTMAAKLSLPRNPSPIHSCRSLREPRSNLQSLAWTRPRASVPHVASIVSRSVRHACGELRSVPKRAHDRCPSRRQPCLGYRGAAHRGPTPSARTSSRRSAPHPRCSRGVAVSLHRVRPAGRHARSSRPCAWPPHPGRRRDRCRRV